MCYRPLRPIAVIDLDEDVMCNAVPVASLDRVLQTPVLQWRGGIIELSRKSSRFRIWCKECFVRPCGGFDRIKHLSIVSDSLTFQDLEAVQGQFCNLIDAPEQMLLFRAWASSAKDEQLAMNKFEEERIYHLSVWRSFDEHSPWFVMIGISWVCDDSRDDTNHSPLK